MKMVFTVAGVPVDMDISRLIIAGWTGRDAEAVNHHIAELEKIGVQPPREVPTFYRVGASLLTQANAIEVVGADSSGEVEFVLFSSGGRIFVGVGSDHTDRKVETYGVTVSKQICAKPVGSELWPLDEIETHWDQLILRSFVTRAGERILYQEGSVARMLAPKDLIARFPDSPGALPPGTAMFCGTLPALGPVAGGELFEIELIDPLRNKRLAHRYAVHALAIAD
jgi:hypothetical protein